MEPGLIIICVVAFFAGFIDSIAGGGGLIQTPAILMLFPQFPVATLLGTTKIPSFSGTAFATYLYARKTPVNLRLLAVLFPVAFGGSLSGAYVITQTEDEFIKPVILALLVVVAVYTFLKKDLGASSSVERPYKKQLLHGFIFGFAIGFYDGMIGPGTGSFFILSFVLLMGNDFLTASVHAKALNLATNLAAILLFSLTGHILYEIAIPMAVCNLCGAYFGTRLALLKGNRFIRIFFLVVVAGTIARFAFDVF